VVRKGKKEGDERRSQGTGKERTGGRKRRRRSLFPRAGERGGKKGGVVARSRPRRARKERNSRGERSFAFSAPSRARREGGEER